MIRHFFLDKTNSIISKSEQNLGLNPILNVSYGDGVTRSLIHFDVEKIIDYANSIWHTKFTCTNEYKKMIKNTSVTVKKMAK